MSDATAGQKDLPPNTLLWLKGFDATADRIGDDTFVIRCDPDRVYPVLNARFTGAIISSMTKGNCHD